MRFDVQFRKKPSFFCVKSSEDASTHVAIRPRTDGQMTARILCARSRDALAHATIRPRTIRLRTTR